MSGQRKCIVDPAGWLWSLETSCTLRSTAANSHGVQSSWRLWISKSQFVSHNTIYTGNFLLLDLRLNCHFSCCFLKDTFTNVGQVVLLCFVSLRKSSK